jgi:hypothetical protein
VHSGQWIEFYDSNGHGNAQPDHYIEGENFILLVEVKLKQTIAAEGQMWELYAPLLVHIYHKPVVFVQAFKYWRFTTESIRSPIEAKPNRMNSWHYMGE